MTQDNFLSPHFQATSREDTWGILVRKNPPKCTGSGWHSGMTQEDPSRDGGNLRDNLWFYLFIVWPGVGKGRGGACGVGGHWPGYVTNPGMAHTHCCEVHIVCGVVSDVVSDVQCRKTYEFA